MNGRSGVVETAPDLGTISFRDVAAAVSGRPRRIGGEPVINSINAFRRVV